MFTSPAAMYFFPIDVNSVALSGFGERVEKIFEKKKWSQAGRK